MIPQYKPVYGIEEAKALYELVMSGSFLADYECTKIFEDKIKSYTNNKYCSVVNNGTVALCIALYACGVRAGDKVIVPNLTMIATANAVSFIGAVPIFCDVEENTGCLDTYEAVGLATEHNAKAIIYVTLNGRLNLGGILNLKKFCENHNIYLIKDDAQSFGSFSDEHRILQYKKYADIHTLSFSPHKIISCGQGGAILTDDDKLGESIERIKDFGRLEGGADVHDFFGINSKFTEMQAVVGIQQISKLQDRILFKRRIYELYYSLLNDLIQDGDIKMYYRGLSTTPWFVDIYLREQESFQITNPRDKLSEYLKSLGIGTRAIYPPINKQKCYNADGEFPVTNKFSSTGLWLPSSFDLTIKDIEFICLKIREFYGKK